MKTIEITSDQDFRIGSKNERNNIPCQDYSLVGEYGDCHYAIVSDGCSDGRYTDVGARVVSFATKKALKRAIGEGSEDFFSKVNFERDSVLNTSLDLFGLPVTDMVATCLYVCVRDGKVYTSLMGDGVVALVYKSGKKVFYNFVSYDSRPFYPIYRNRGHQESFRDKEEVLLKEIAVKGDPASEWILLEEETYAPEEVFGGVEMVFDIESEDNELEMIALFSDGVTSAQPDLLEDCVPWYEVTDAFLSFKQKNGVFVKRRVRRQLDTYKKEGVDVKDDISCAVINFKEKEDEDSNQ